MGWVQHGYDLRLRHHMHTLESVEGLESTRQADCGNSGGSHEYLEAGQVSSGVVGYGHDVADVGWHVEGGLAW